MPPLSRRWRSIEARSLPLRRPAQRARRSQLTPAHRTHDMTAFVSRRNMEFHKSHIWLTAIALLATCGSCGRAPANFTPTDSITDFINYEYVNKRKLELERGEDSPPPEPRPHDALRGFDFRKLFNSSKDALEITKKKFLKSEWCKTGTFVQRIKAEHCKPVKVIQKYCYGQCNSYYIPKGAQRGEAVSSERHPRVFKSCSICRPKQLEWTTVKLHCPRLDPPYKLKRLQMIRECRCLPAKESVNWI